MSACGGVRGIWFDAKCDIHWSLESHFARVDFALLKQNVSVRRLSTLWMSNRVPGITYNGAGTDAASVIA